MIYTSGSTGSPKAVRVAHASLAYLCRAVNERYGVGPEDRVLQFAALSFDTSIEQILNTLLNGATLVLPEYAWAPSELPGRLVSHGVTVMDLTPSYWRAFLAELAREPVELPVRLTIVGGSAVHAEDCRTALRLMPDSRLVNAYGLTETTITSCTMEITAEALPQGPAPVGRPLPGTVVRVLDERLNPVPPGRHGEIYLGGPGVAQGYLGDEERSRQRFVTLPGAAAGTGTVYRTGDLGGWTADGNLEIVGRADRQLKIRGFRVEPAEIEAALSAHGLVDDAAVTSFAHRGGPARRLLHRPARPAPLDPGELRAFTARHLPAYMVPARFVQLDAMPTTAHGKTDFAALPDPSELPGALRRPVPGRPRRTSWSAPSPVCGVRCSVWSRWGRSTTSSIWAAIRSSRPS
ncbi:amino acid adenylation domain-containing protein [Streptomyces nogalater]